MKKVKKIFAPLYTPFVEQRKTLIVSLTLTVLFEGPFELLHADIADIKFLGKSVVDSKYCLLSLNVLISIICMYPMKNRSLLSKKVVLF